MPNYRLPQDHLWICLSGDFKVLKRITGSFWQPFGYFHNPGREFGYFTILSINLPVIRILFIIIFKSISLKKFPVIFLVVGHPETGMCKSSTSKPQLVSFHRSLSDHPLPPSRVMRAIFSRYQTVQMPLLCFQLPQKSLYLPLADGILMILNDRRRLLCGQLSFRFHPLISSGMHLPGWINGFVVVERCLKLRIKHTDPVWISLIKSLWEVNEFPAILKRSYFVICMRKEIWRVKINRNFNKEGEATGDCDWRRETGKNPALSL